MAGVFGLVSAGNPQTPFVLVPPVSWSGFEPGGQWLEDGDLDIDEVAPKEDPAPPIDTPCAFLTEGLEPLDAERTRAAVALGGGRCLQGCHEQNDPMSGTRRAGSKTDPQDSLLEAISSVAEALRAGGAPSHGAWSTNSVVPVDSPIAAQSSLGGSQLASAFAALGHLVQRRGLA